MNTPKEIIRQYGIRPKKKFSQSFLVDANIIKKIVEASRISPEDVVVEIGSGIGVLTADLIQKARKLIAVELDNNLVSVLKEKLSGQENCEIFLCDILKFDFFSISDKYNTKVKVVGNVPYNISSPLIFHLLSYRANISEFTIMLQKEVVERLAAIPGNKNYGVPSVLLQMFARVKKIMDVPASCFYPRPKVESAVIRGTFLDNPLIELTDAGFFAGLVKASFAQRRKKLINNLKKSSLLADIGEDKIKEALTDTGIDGNCRGETLSVEEFGRLSNLLYKYYPQNSQNNAR